MNTNHNQLIFEEFQKSVDQARLLAQKLGPEHFYLAYDRCAKLQKVIFKRACGYCFSPEDSNDSNIVGNPMKKVEISVNEKNDLTNVSYLNLPSFSLCGSNFPLFLSGQNCMNHQTNLRIFKLIMLKQYTETIPSAEDEAILDREGYVVNQPYLSISESLKELIKTLLKHFPNCGDVNYDLCLPQKANPVLIVPITDDDYPKLQSIVNQESCLFLRPPIPAMKIELSLPSPTFPNSDNSIITTRINSFMADADKNQMSDDSVIPDVNEGSVFPETIFSCEGPTIANMDITLTDDCKSRSTRQYNWSVVLSNLHENHPTQLRNESVRFPDVCHELHAIPPTPQKLRPTKRCQLCLKGYKSRKESRYYCRPCDKGFHIKCFEVYHQQLGYVQYKVKIISGDR